MWGGNDLLLRDKSRTLLAILSVTESLAAAVTCFLPETKPLNGIDLRVGVVKKRQRGDI